MTDSERDLRHVSSVISVTSAITVAFSWIAGLVAAIIFFTSPGLSEQKKLFYLCILGVCVIGLQIVIWIARREPVTLVIFTLLCAFFSAFTLGVSISFV